MKTNVILDISGILYRNFYGMTKEKTDIIIAMANMSAFDSVNFNYKKFACDETVLAFDGKKNWRKSYTRRSPDVVTYKQYKGNRREELTDSEKAKLAKFDEHVVEFREIITKYTGLLVLFNDHLEADDMIAGYVQSRPKEKHIIVSQDRDFLQLQRQPNVFQEDPKTKKKLTLEEYDDDPDYFMFQKNIRGDIGDWVMSSYPRVRVEKIKAAYENEYERTNMMKNKFKVKYVDEKSGETKIEEFITGEVFDENEMLMDLSKQPQGIRDLITESLQDSVDNRGRYDMLKFLKFCGRHDLQHLIQNITKYTAMLKGPKRDITA